MLRITLVISNSNWTEWSTIQGVTSKFGREPRLNAKVSRMFQQSYKR